MNSIEDDKTELLIQPSDYSSLKEIFKAIFNDTKLRSEQTRKYLQFFPTTSSLLESLNIQRTKGLDMKNKVDIEKRKKVFDSYQKYKGSSYSYFFYLKAAFNDEILIELIKASILSLFIGILKEGFQHGWIDAVSTLVSVLIVAFSTSIFNSRKGKKFETLKREIEKREVIVRRDGEIVKIKEKDLITGDIMKLQPGDVITVPGVLITGQCLCYQSETKKMCGMSSEDPNCMLINPTMIVNQGEGEMVVILVEKEGKTVSNRGEREESELTKEIHSLSESIGEIGYVMGFLIGFIMVGKSIIYNYVKGGSFLGLEIIEVFVDAYIIAEALKIVAIPEGLPMAGNISLAFSISSMIEDKVIINRLDKISSISKMNYLLINRAAVTSGDPKVKEAYIRGKYFDQYKNKSAFSIFNHIVMNTTNSVVKVGKKYAPRGEPIDNSLLNFLIENCNESMIENALVKKDSEYRSQIINQIPFNPAYNYVMSLVKNPSKNPNYPYVAYVKGYADNVLGMCKYYTTENGQRDITLDIRELITKYTKKGYTVIILAEKETSSMEIKENFYEGFSIVGIIGISDVPQEKIYDSIKLCHKSGINLKMVTSENVESSVKTCGAVKFLTSEEIKKTEEVVTNKKKLMLGEKVFGEEVQPLPLQLLAGMYSEDFIKYIGGYLKNSNENPLGEKENSQDKSSSLSVLSQKYNYSIKNTAVFKEAIEKVKLIGNASSEEKQVIISGIKQINPKKNIIGVTYGGTFESEDLSLRLADIMYSTSLSSANLEDEEGDVVLLSQSLSTILSSVAHSRNIYDCIRKFVQYQLTICLSTVIFAVIGSFFFVDTPLSPVQMLWINIIMDSLGALALATDTPEKSILEYKPYTGTLFNQMMFVNIILQFIFQISVLMVFLVYGAKVLGVESDQFLRHHEWNNVNGVQITFIFNLFVFLQIFNLFNCRKVHAKEYNVFKGLTKNYCFILVVIAITSIQLVFVNFGGRAIRTKPLSLSLQLLSIGIASFSLVLTFFAKLFLTETEKTSEKLSLKKNSNSKTKEKTREQSVKKKQS